MTTVQAAGLALSLEDEAALEEIRAAARIRHEKARRAAAQRGRIHFPMLPYECSWAYETEFRRKLYYGR